MTLVLVPKKGPVLKGSTFKNRGDTWVPGIVHFMHLLVWLIHLKISMDEIVRHHCWSLGGPQ